MANLRTGHRRRSQSSPSHHRKSPESGLWRSHAGATKRAHPHTSFLGADSSPAGQKMDASEYRAKRRRRNASSSPSMAGNVDPFSWSLPSSSSSRTPTPKFAATAAEFGLYPERNRPWTASPSTPSSSDLSYSREQPAPIDLARIQSNAFGELQRSVVESGEGFVRRMRDYEHSRSRADESVSSVNLRGRRRSPAPSDAYSNMEDSDDDDDDVQIFAEDLSLHRRPHSSQSMHVDGARCPSPAQSDGQASFANTFSSGRSEADTFGSSASSVMEPTFTEPSSPPSSRSEKAIAALGLAMANGAGSLNDYQELVAFQSNHAFGEDFHDDAGELWH